VARGGRSRCLPRPRRRLPAVPAPRRAPQAHLIVAEAAFAASVPPSGAAAADERLVSATAMRFGLTRDQPNNRVLDAAGRARSLGTATCDAEGRAGRQWDADFHRHDMGPGRADPVDANGFGSSIWPTRWLGGVGPTGPWLPDGRATTLDEAIRADGGAAATSRGRDAALDAPARDAVVRFSEKLVIVDRDPEPTHALPVRRPATRESVATRFPGQSA
jgi:hypothetical protein